MNENSWKEAAELLARAAENFQTEHIVLRLCGSGSSAQASRLRSLELEQFPDSTQRVLEFLRGNEIRCNRQERWFSYRLASTACLLGLLLAEEDIPAGVKGCVESLLAMSRKAIESGLVSPCCISSE